MAGGTNAVAKRTSAIPAEEDLVMRQLSAVATFLLVEKPVEHKSLLAQTNAGDPASP